MKRIFKFFPVALAAFALASCSSDDLNVTNSAGELLNVDGNLLVQVEGGDEGTMRSGFMTTINPTSTMLRSSLFFSEGDQLKLYHEATSWKPEVWTASEFGQYKNADGAAGGDVAVFDNATATITDDEKAYGIFPATIGQFGNENRTSLKYDLSELQFIEYKAEAKDYNDGSVNVTSASDATGNTKAYTAPFPLWGVKNAGAKVMTVKHLTGILRFDLANIDNSTMTAAQARYIVIKSVNKLTGELATATDVFNPTAVERVDPNDLMTKAPKLVTKAPAGGDPTTNIAAVPTTAAGLAAAGAEDVIVVELTKDDPNHVMLFLPITAGNGETTPGTPDVTIYVSKPVAKGSSLALGTGALNQETKDGTAGSPDAIYQLTADLIEAENKAQLSGYSSLSAPEKQKVQAGVFYRINDDYSNQNTTATTPFELTKGIIEADKKAYRDFEITFTQPIEVKNTGVSNPQNNYIDFTNTVADYRMTELAPEGWELKHNVTVNVTLKESDDAGTTPSVLFVKTKGGKKLTLNIQNGTTAVDSIVVKANDLKSDVVLREATGGAQLPAIHVYKDNDKKLTLEAGTPALVVNSTVSVDNESGQAVSKVVLAKDVDKINLLNGAVTDISIADAGATDPYEAIDDDVTIYTEGTAAIGNVAYANMPTDAGTAVGNIIDKYNLKFESKWIAGSTATTHATTTINSAGTYITSAAQLAGVAVATGDITVLGKYDLDGSTSNVWTALGSTALTQSITGAQYFRASDAAVRAIEGNATIKNLYSVKGLIESWTPAAGKAISNFTFDGGNKVIGAANAGALGLLVGTVTSTNGGTIKNIKVKGTNQVTGSGTTATAMQAYGAVIGKSTDATAALNIVNVQVASGTTVRGYQYVGGIVGEIAGKVIFGLQSADGTTDKLNNTAAVATGDVANSSAATLETFKVGTAPYSSALPTKGSFFGGASASATAGDITIIGQLASLSTARTGAEWGYYVPNAAGTEYFPWTIQLNYNEIGHCGTTMAGSAVTVTTGFTAFHMLTPSTGTTPTYSVSTNLVPFVGTQSTYNTNVAATATYGIGKTMYFDFVKQP